MALKSKVFRYAVTLDRDGTMHAEDGGALRLPQGWTADHMVMAAIVKCSLSSLGHHAARAGIAVVESEGDARGTVARRAEDGRFAIVEVDVHLSVRLDPPPSPEIVRELVAKAERGCFVGSSLRARPVYRWRVDGVEVAPREIVEAAA